MYGREPWKPLSRLFLAARVQILPRLVLSQPVQRLPAQFSSSCSASCLQATVCLQLSQVDPVSPANPPRFPRGPWSQRYRFRTSPESRETPQTFCAMCLLTGFLFLFSCSTHLSVLPFSPGNLPQDDITSERLPHPMATLDAHPWSLLASWIYSDCNIKMTCVLILLPTPEIRKLLEGQIMACLCLCSMLWFERLTTSGSFPTCIPAGPVPPALSRLLWAIFIYSSSSIPI